jgi:Flp pilus assembly CpaF family ATPase
VLRRVYAAAVAAGLRADNPAIGIHARPKTEQGTLATRRYLVRHHRRSGLGTLPPDAVALVEAYARAGASIVIAGPGGAGKSTLLWFESLGSIS